MDSFNEYLKPTRLCDFDQEPAIKTTALKLTEKSTNRRQQLDCVCKFVKELPYGLEDWDIKASETMRKGWGMCSAKTNLLVAMLRAVGIPARYRIIRTKGEGTLWKWIAQQNDELTHQMGQPPPEQDHVVAEVYIDSWEVCDLSRDTPLEKGMEKLNIPRKRESASNQPQITILASFDEWAQARQEARRFKENRELVFSRVNAQFDKIRALGAK